MKINLYILAILLIKNIGNVKSFGDDELSHKIDTDLFLEDEGGSGNGEVTTGSGSGPPTDDEDVNIIIPKITDQPNNINNNNNKKKKIFDDNGGEKVVIPTTSLPAEFETKHDGGNFFSQPGILAAIICGAIVGLLCAILLVMFIVYRMRKKDEGSYVLEDSKRTSSYGKSKEFFA